MDSLFRSYSLAVGLAIPGLASPVLFTVWWRDVRGRAKDGGRGDGPSNVLVRSHSLAVGLSILGFASPVLFVVGGWMYWEGLKGKARDDRVQGTAGKKLG